MQILSVDHQNGQEGGEIDQDGEGQLLVTFDGDPQEMLGNHQVSARRDRDGFGKALKKSEEQELEDFQPEFHGIPSNVDWLLMRCPVRLPAGPEPFVIRAVIAAVAPPSEITRDQDDEIQRR